VIVSTENPAEGGRAAGSANAAPSRKRPRQLLEPSDAAQIAQQIIEKHGVDALGFAQSRVLSAREVGDELALEAWHTVIAAMQALLRRMAPL
jgi:hypothetical protein